jgi:hypothetical protein
MPEVMESASSLGQIYQDDQYVADVAYRFDIGEDTGELTRIWGYLEVAGRQKDRFAYGDELTLYLSDGSQIDITIKTWDFNNQEYLVLTREGF